MDKINKTKLIESEVNDDISYNHFKKLIRQSNDLCKGKTLKNTSYKVRISMHKDFSTLIKNKHHRIIYIHDNKKIYAYISVKIYYTSGNFLFIHKLCSSKSGLGSYLMEKILNYARLNTQKLNISYLSLTTFDLGLIEYYNKFKPTKIFEVKHPGSKKLNAPKVAYIIWQLTDKMPNLHYE